MTEGTRPDDVVVVSAGACTAAGRTAASVAAAARARIRSFRRHPSWRDAREQPRVVAAAPWLGLDLDAERRSERLGRRAIAEALRPLARGASLPISLPVWWSDDPDGQAPSLRRSWWARSLEPIARRPTVGDQVAGLAALEAVAREERPWALWGGATSLLDPARIERLAAQDALWPEHPRGAVAGEGAAAILIARRSFGAGLGLAARARVLATAAGEGWRRALEEHPVDAIVVDDDGTEARLADLRGLGDLGTAVFAPAKTWGRVGAAAGPLLVATALFSPAVRTAVITTVAGSPQVLVLAREDAP